MSNKISTNEVIISALLVSLGIIIPMFSPIKLILEPASFTLASHVAIFIAMFISRKVAISVTLGTTLGFFISGYPIVVVARALSHLVFVIIGSTYLHNKSDVLDNFKESFIYSLVIGIIHGVSEVAIVLPFYISSSLSSGYYDKGFIQGVVVLVGIGTIIHSMLDFSLSRYIWGMIPKSFIQKSDKLRRSRA